MGKNIFLGIYKSSRDLYITLQQGSSIFFGVVHFKNQKNLIASYICEKMHTYSVRVLGSKFIRDISHEF